MMKTFLNLLFLAEVIKAEADPRGFTEDPIFTEEKFREKGKMAEKSLHLLVSVSKVANFD